MEKYKKLIFILAPIVLIVLIVGIVILINTGKKEDIPSVNEDNNVEEKVPGESGISSDSIESFEFKIDDETFEEGTSSFTVTVTNKTNEAKYLNTFALVPKDENGNSMISIYGIIDEEIEANGTRTIICSYGGDVSNYSSMDYKIEK